MSTQEQFQFYIIGIGNHSVPVIAADVLLLIKNNHYFSGGKRHYELMRSLLPQIHCWIEISGKMDAVIANYSTIGAPIVVFASGDPFFYGFGNTLKKYVPQARIKAFPYFNSIQRLCQKTLLDYSQLKTASVHGRNWSALDTLLIKGEPLIGVLTDAKKTPAAIAARLLQYGFDNYKITIGEELDGSLEKISTPSLIDCQYKSYKDLNCIVLEQISAPKKSFGIPDSAFQTLPNRSNMITKMPIRLCTLNALALQNATVFWDIGSCTGSVAIEAKKQFPEVEIIAFEKREACKSIIQFNKEQFSTPGIAVVIADFFDLELTNYPKPEVVFIGGHGNRLKEMIVKLVQVNPNIRLVTNAVQETTTTVFVAVLSNLGYLITSTRMQINDHNTITIHTAEKIER